MVPKKRHLSNIQGRRNRCQVGVLETRPAAVLEHACSIDPTLTAAWAPRLASALAALPPMVPAVASELPQAPSPVGRYSGTSSRRAARTSAAGWPELASSRSVPFTTRSHS